MGLGLYARISALEAEVKSLREPTQWLPIETAPKDVDIILGRAKSCEDDWDLVAVGHWQEAEEDGSDYMGSDAGFVDLQYTNFHPGRSFGSPKRMYDARQPTHWMPLPQPPKE